MDNYESMDFTKKQICSIVSGSLCCLFVVIVFAISWDTVEPTEWGLLYNSITKDITKSHIYDGGRYFVWPFHHFLNFPATLETIEFSNSSTAKASPLSTRTKEGLAVQLAVAFQYQLIKEQIPKLYEMANRDYETTFIRIARDVILQAAGKYEAPEYWINRKKISNEMQKELQTELGKAHAVCSYLQILKIELPASYEQSIVETQVEVQNKRMKAYEQEAAVIRQEINIMRSDNDRQIKAINASGFAEAYRIKQNATAFALNNTITAEADSYESVLTDVGLKNDELNKYIYFLSLMSKKDAKLAVGFNNGIINILNDHQRTPVNGTA